eukprot:TRINITY_DN1720_c1_g1_i4.p1 TRINITY_DN1720_c1_g1~~TRINITY_DN1720_c1_g1_i4.p1  ORF type:complete len:111 (+),score=6.67 TRINITY_DN1720_c1_g1_i4:299-631(+)
MELDRPLFMLRSYARFYFFFLILREKIFDLRFSGTINFKPALDELLFPIRRPCIQEVLQNNSCCNPQVSYGSSLVASSTVSERKRRAQFSSCKFLSFCSQMFPFTDWADI